MAVLVLFFGVDDLYQDLKPIYTYAIQNGDMEVAAYAKIDNDRITWIDAEGKTENIEQVVFDYAILSTEKNFYSQKKMLEKMGVPKNQIIDGRAFMIENLDVPQLLNYRIAYSVVNGNKVTDNTHCIYPRIYRAENKKFWLSLGLKSYLASAEFEGIGFVEAGKFCALGWNILFELRMNNFHNYKNVSSYAAEVWDGELPEDFIKPLDDCKIEIGNDVWIGRGAILKSNNPKKPLKIGDGAVIAADSVVVKNVPPYAIVGGNPAQILKYRFDEKTIESLLKIQWWDWELDKIYENFKYFNRVEEFISMHFR